MAKSVRYRAYLELVRIEAINRAQCLGWATPERARINLHFGVKTVPKETRMYPHKLDRPYRPHDWDNAVSAFKAGQDGLVQAKVLAGDDRNHLEGGSVTFDPASGPWVRVTVEALV
jgi:hypothetical protein